MDLNEHYRFWLHTRKPECDYYERATDIPVSASCARIGRENDSFAGLGKLSKLVELEASNANQDMLEEISRLSALQYLDLGWPLVAKDLTPLLALENLQVLKIDSPRHMTDFSPLSKLPKLERLFLTNAKHCDNLDWLRPLKNQLIALGIEGSTWTKHTIPTLEPLNGFALEALFLTNTKLADQDLSPLATMRNLRFLGTALNAPKAEFMALKARNAGLECSWFDEALWATFKDPRPPKQS
ncbi:hypothetical protein [Erythrobacter alti]|uniref:hypothetical protein n=1 Tax=Erythrobacter alti TaxID=1896145 RepID=UPI0030F3742E